MKLPKFVNLNKSALRLTGDIYYRDGGNWSVGYRYENDVLKSVSSVESVNNIPLIEITEKEWRKDNGQYAPKKIINMSKVIEPMDYWVIYDDTGIIHTGSEEDMHYAFEVMIEPTAYGKAIRKQYESDWKGELCLSNTTKIYK